MLCLDMGIGVLRRMSRGARRRECEMSHLYVATNGLSVWSSSDLGETLLRMSTGTGMYSGSQVWALALHPSSPHVLLAGTNTGIYCLNQEEENWTHIPSPMDDAMLVTALAYAPDNPDVIMAGTQPAGLYRSEDAGKSWRNLGVPMKPYALTGYYQGDNPFPEGHPAAYGRKHWTRVTQIVFDPADSLVVFAGVEIDGAWRSIDGGKRWERSDRGMKSQDIHGFVVVHNGESRSFRNHECWSACQQRRRGELDDAPDRFRVAIHPLHR